MVKALETRAQGALPLLVWLLLSLIWGSTWLVIKVGLNAGLPPLTFAGLRFALAALTLVGVLGARRVRLPQNAGAWGVMALTGLLTFTLNYGLVFWGERHISSGLTAILFSTSPLFSLGLAHWLVPGERFSLGKLAGVALGIGGVGLIFYRQIHLSSELALWGSAAVVASALISAWSSMIVKNRAVGLDPMLLTTVQMGIGMVPLLLGGAALEGNPLAIRWTPAGAGALLYLAWVGSAFPFVLLYWLFGRMPVTHINLIALSSTLLAVLLGWLVLGEGIGWNTLGGGVAILAGLALAMRRLGPARRGEGTAV